MKFTFTLIALVITASSFAQFTFQNPINNTQNVSNRQAVVPIVADISYQGYDETQAYFGEGEYEIFLDNVNGVLDKPIIILDGFDPGDARDINGLYNSFSFGGQNLADIVRDEGFDIVILNAPQYTTGGKTIDGGADYIQRNAMVLVALIEEINAQKVGSEQLVVLGPSMGGLIARYGLSYMEQNSLVHDTRLYISFDSPHKGANIPISLQYLINYLAEEFSDAQAQAIVDTVLNSPAAKEMLYDHLLGHLLAGSPTQQDPTKLLPAGAPDFRDAFQAELDALGFPQDVRNVAMINGTDNGTTVGMPGMQVVETTLDITTGVTADLTLHFTPEANQTINVTTFSTFIVGIPTGTFEADAQSGTVAGVDAAPGGLSLISNALGGGGGNPVIQDFVDALDQDEFSFIPTISALALESEDNWYATPDLNDSPFVATHIPSTNERHVQPTTQNILFALSEIRQVPLGVNDVSIKSRFQLKQNPVTKTAIDVLVNTPATNGTLSVVIYNQLGQALLQQTSEISSNEISIAHTLSAGFYFITLSDANGSQTLKFLVK
ncbi:T9SS type A sorting domain-containing protein [Rasiella rasia]|uniref:T9SS type A sorting domain-containing protein n=1 Tax=Rasiella rasia TaxID=2744027 RepID=A0A6G6GI20_9FLAO|nr:T9SS type A sorting domain-containing protein [Rasiella rasia]QIE58063.1 T9SS type A sorting domain-containing protein [Rasiella rasia]